MVTTPEPAEEAVTIFNELARLPASAREALKQKAWRLAALERNRPGDPWVLLARARLSAKLGDAEGLRAVLDRLWPLYPAFDEQQLEFAARHFLLAGMFERVWAVLDQRQETPAYHGQLRLEAALGLGDPVRLQRLADSRADEVGRVRRFLEGMENADLREHLPALATITRQRVGEAFCGFGATLGEDETDAFPQAYLRYLVPWAFDDRFATEQALLQDLRAYAEQNGLTPGAVLEAWLVALMDSREF